MQDHYSTVDSDTSSDDDKDEAVCVTHAFSMYIYYIRM